MLVPLISQESFWPESFPLTELEYFIGRLPSSSIISTNDSVSRQHARLVYYENQWYVEDLGSRNGSHLDGQPIASTILSDGQILQTGDHWFAFTLQNPENFDADSFALWVGGMRQRAELIAHKHDIPPTAPMPTSPPPPAVLPKPPAAILSNTMSLAASPVTRSYPARQPQKAAKVSAILHLPGAQSASVSSTPITAASLNAPVLVPSSKTQAPSSLVVTGPDYLWYAVIVLAVVGLLLALVVFFVRRGQDDSESGSLFRHDSIQHVVAQQDHRTVR